MKNSQIETEEEIEISRIKRKKQSSKTHTILVTHHLTYYLKNIINSQPQNFTREKVYTNEK